MKKAPMVSRNPMSEFTLRVISALILVVFALYFTWIGGFTFTLLCAVAGFLILLEYTNICGGAIPARIRTAAFAVYLLVVAAWFTDQFSLAIAIAGFSSLLLGLWQWFVSRSIWGGAGIAYATLPFFALIELRAAGRDGLVVILVLFACVWGADIFAYFTGRLVGGPKLAPRISPKKTIAGFIGGMAGGILLAYAIARIFNFYPGPAFVGLVLGVSIISQLGDLLESALKRRFEVKDSGRLIPGHGGVLDRIDGLIAAGVVLWLLVLTLAWVQQSSTSLPQNIINAFLRP